MITYRATLDVPGELVASPRGCWPPSGAAGAPRGSRALTCFGQAVLGLRWFRDRTRLDALARDHGVSRATAYRYLDEAVGVLTRRRRSCPRRWNGRGRGRAVRDPGRQDHRGDRCPEKTTSVKGEVIDVWYSGKARRHGGNVQAVFRPDGFPLWVRMPSPARSTTSPPPAATPCPRCTGLPRPACRPSLIPATKARASASVSRSKIPRTGGDSISVPAPVTPSCGRSAASANGGWPCSPGAGGPSSTSPSAPSKIGDIARAALVLVHFEHGYIT